ncbi:MAG TPA: patatin family protein [Planococcus sp. (in: firmicutes)]|nr:patatin family protein [Planococcus sp. (in: firmicutes)]
MFDSGLVLEGGGMRGVYTAGVLEYFMEKDLYLPYVIGVSAGACNAASYISRQPGRNRSVTIDFVKHPEYISMRNLLTKRELFGMDLIFDQIPNELVPFDFETFHAADGQFIVGTTDCYTGKPVYFNKKDSAADILAVIRASSSIPFMAPPVAHQGKLLMDGGISDPIPIQKALHDGVEKNIVILTQAKGYRKKRSYASKATRYFYKEYIGLAHAMEIRWKIYNDTLDRIEQMENSGEIFVIRPSEELKGGRAERNSEKLELMHKLGYLDAQHAYGSMHSWLQSNSKGQFSPVLQ